MKIILTKTEKEVLESIAKYYNISAKGLTADYEVLTEANFEQDLHNMSAEDEDYIRQEYGSYEEGE